MRLVQFCSLELAKTNYILVIQLNREKNYVAAATVALLEPVQVEIFQEKNKNIIH